VQKDLKAVSPFGSDHGICAADDAKPIGLDLLAAGPAYGSRMKLGAALVREDHGLRSGVDVTIAPLLDRQDDRSEILARIRQVVLVARRPLGVAPTLDDPKRFEALQA
jgi:hypothetical protein